MSQDPILRALANCNPNEALEPTDPRFVDLDDIRGQALRKYLLKLLRAADSVEHYEKVAVAGNRGSGKSTELNRAETELQENGYVTLWASVNENLDPKEISFSDIIRLIVQLIDDRFGQETAHHPQVKEAFDSVRQWFQEVTKSFTEQINSAKDLGLRARLGGGVGVEGGAEAGVNAGAIAKGGLKIKTELGELSAAISVIRRSEGSERTEIRETLERYNNQLVLNLNSLLRAVTDVCCPRKSLVIILDNVDKYEPGVVNQAFLRNADLFREIDSHLIFTIQSSLLHNPVEDAVDQCFRTFVLPMLPIFIKNTRKLETKVVERVREAVYKRVPLELFAAVGTVDDVIKASGGCWRDLLRLLQEALLRAETQIGPGEVRAAVQQVGQTYQRLLRSKDDLEILAEAHLKHTVLSDERTQYLLHHLCLLSYNGEGWYDFHPLLDNYAPVKEAVKEAVEAERKVNVSL
jgi:Fe-S-cluster formation regulator IscX/YfhJ